MWGTSCSCAAGAKIYLEVRSMSMGRTAQLFKANFPLFSGQVNEIVVQFRSEQREWRQFSVYFFFPYAT